MLGEVQISVVFRPGLQMQYQTDDRQKNSVKWSSPAEGTAKLNTNGSFVSMHEVK
jgi:hypothetical protein